MAHRVVNSKFSTSQEKSKNMENILEEHYIDNLKKLLASRDTKLQVKAVNIISNTLVDAKIDFMTFQKTTEKYIENDLCIHLSEAIATLDTKLLRKIILCLKGLSCAQAFYNNSCCPYVTTALVRATNLYIKEENNENAVKSLLQFLGELFLRIKPHYPCEILPYDGLYDTMQIFSLLNSMTDDNIVTIDTFILCTKILHLILTKKTVFVTLNTKIIENLVLTIENYLEKLCSVLQYSDVKLYMDYEISYIYGIAFYICIDAIELYYILSKYQSNQLTHTIPIDRILNFNIINIEKNVKFIHKIVSFLIEQLTDLWPYLNFICHEKILKLIKLYLQNQFLKNIAPIFAQFLVKNNFLVYLPRLRLVSQNDIIKRLCHTNLVELIVILSCLTFNLSKWEGGEEAFRNHLYEGFLNNNDDLNLWPQKLFDVYASESTIDSLIIFLYFYCLNVNNSQIIAQALFPAIVNYILAIKSEVTCSIPIIKCLWLIFAMARFPEIDLSKIDGGIFRVEKASYKLSKLVSIDMENVYTHDIAILEWAYSTRIPFATQYGVLSQWLKNENTLPAKFISLISVWWSLVEIVRNGIKFAIASATEILKSCLKEVCDEKNAKKIKITLWESLPDILAIYVEEGKFDDEETLIHMLDLCTSEIPPSIDESVVRRLTFFIIMMIPMLSNCSNHLLYLVLLELKFLLDISLQHKKAFVLSQSINSKILLELIDATIKLDVSVSTLACKILAVLAYNCDIYNLECKMPITINIRFIMEVLKHEQNDQKCISVMQLFYTSLKVTQYSPPNKNKLLYFPSDFNCESSINGFMSIFFRLQIVCCKESVQQSQSAWKCLNLMVDYAANKENDIILKKVASQPWTNILIRYYISQNDPSKVHIFFFNFIYLWLCCIKTLKSKFEITSFKNTFKQDNSNVTIKTINLIACTLHNYKNEDVLSNEKTSLLAKISDIINDI